MNFGNVKKITIPEGKVKEIIDSAGKSLWKAGPGYIYLKLIDRSISGTYTNETVESIGGDAFSGCAKLTTANFPAVMSIGARAFSNCSALTTVDFPAVTNIGESAFSECAKLTTVDFPAVTNIGDYAFSVCYKLTTINFPAAISIGDRAFQGCTSLTTTNFQTVVSIGAYAFNRCISLTTANFPAVTSIGDYAFVECSALTALILRSETMATLSNANPFKNTPIASGTGYIYVPATLVDTYKTATNWSTYSNQIRAIEDYPEITGGEAA